MPMSVTQSLKLHRLETQVSDLQGQMNLLLNWISFRFGDESGFPPQLLQVNVQNRNRRFSQSQSGQNFQFQQFQSGSENEESQSIEFGTDIEEQESAIEMETNTKPLEILITDEEFESVEQQIRLFNESANASNSSISSSSTSKSNPGFTRPSMSMAMTGPGTSTDSFELRQHFVTTGHGQDQSLDTNNLTTIIPACGPSGSGAAQQGESLPLSMSRKAQKPQQSKNLPRPQPGPRLSQSEFHCHYPQCFKTFSHLSSLGQHIKLHPPQIVSADGDQSFKCYICNQTFFNKGQLSAHHKTQHNLGRYFNEDEHEEPESEIFICEFRRCKKCFGTRNALSQHVKLHQSLARPYSCEFCGKKYGLVDSLNKHRRMIHSGNINRKQQQQQQQSGIETNPETQETSEEILGLDLE